MSRVPAAAAVLLLGGCIPPASEAPPAPQPEPVATPEAEPLAPPPAPPPPAPAAQDNWMDAAQTAGDWRWRNAGGESRAEFRNPAGEVLVALTCTASRQVTLAVANRWPDASGLRLRTETRDATLPTTAREGFVEARLPASDTLLDAIAFSRGRFALEVTGGAALYVPSYPEITRVVEDCRS